MDQKGSEYVKSYKIDEKHVLSNKTGEDEMISLKMSSPSVKSGNTVVDINKNNSMCSQALDLESQDNPNNYSGLIEDDG